MSKPRLKNPSPIADERVVTFQNQIIGQTMSTPSAVINQSQNTTPKAVVEEKEKTIKIKKKNRNLRIRGMR